MKPNPYSSVAAQTSTAEELNYLVFNSIKLYLQDYKDTSKTKADRKRAIESARTILEWTLEQCSLFAKTTDEYVLMYGLNKVKVIVLSACDNTDKIYDVSDAIGFMRILSSKD